MNQPPQIARHPFIVGYSLILPATWISICLLLVVIAPGRRLGVVGTALMFMAVAAFTSWLFVRRYHRDYTDREYWKLIIYCAIWAVSLELFVLFTAIVLPLMEAGHLEAAPVAFAVLLTIAVDFLFSWLSFRQTGRRLIAWYLRKEGPNQLPEPTAPSGRGSS
jgi:hypothetical protein